MKTKGLQRRHLTGVQRAPKLRRFWFLFFRAVNFSAFDAFAQCLLDGSQDSVAPFCILLVLLIIIQPKGRVNADKHEDQFRCPATNT